MNRINKQLLEARQQDTEVKIREAQWLENLRNNGKSPEDIELTAREILGIDENGSVIATASEVIPKINLAKMSLIQINGLTANLKDANLISQEEEVFLNAIEKRLAVQVSKFFNLENVYEE